MDGCREEIVEYYRLNNPVAYLPLKGKRKIVKSVLSVFEDRRNRELLKCRDKGFWFSMVLFSAFIEHDTAKEAIPVIIDLLSLENDFDFYVKNVLCAFCALYQLSQISDVIGFIEFMAERVFNRMNEENKFLLIKVLIIALSEQNSVDDGCLMISGFIRTLMIRSRTLWPESQCFFDEYARKCAELNEISSDWIRFVKELLQSLINSDGGPHEFETEMLRCAQRHMKLYNQFSLTIERVLEAVEQDTTSHPLFILNSPVDEFYRVFPEAIKINWRGNNGFGQQFMRIVKFLCTGKLTSYVVSDFASYVSSIVETTDSEEVICAVFQNYHYFFTHFPEKASSAIPLIYKNAVKLGQVKDEGWSVLTLSSIAFRPSGVRNIIKGAGPESAENLMFSALLLDEFNLFAWFFKRFTKEKPETTEIGLIILSFFRFKSYNARSVSELLSEHISNELSSYSVLQGLSSDTIECDSRLASFANSTALIPQIHPSTHTKPINSFLYNGTILSIHDEGDSLTVVERGAYGTTGFCVRRTPEKPMKEVDDLDKPNFLKYADLRPNKTDEFTDYKPPPPRETKNKALKLIDDLGFFNPKSQISVISDESIIQEFDKFLVTPVFEVSVLNITSDTTDISNPSTSYSDDFVKFMNCLGEGRIYNGTVYPHFDANIVDVVYTISRQSPVVFIFNDTQYKMKINRMEKELAVSFTETGFDSYRMEVLTSSVTLPYRVGVPYLVHSNDLVFVAGFLCYLIVCTKHADLITMNYDGRCRVIETLARALREEKENPISYVESSIEKLFMEV